MTRRLLRACLAAVLLVSPVLRASAKPPDLPLGMQTPVGPMSDQDSEAPTGDAPAPSAPVDLPALPPAVVEAMPHVPAPAWPLGLRPREQRQLKACLLVTVNPLLVLTPLMDEKCDRGGDRPMTVINGIVCPAPVKMNAVEARCCGVASWMRRQVIASKEIFKVEINNVPNVTPSPAKAVQDSAQDGTNDAARDVLERTKTNHDCHYQEMRDKALKVMSLATEKFRAHQIDAAIDILQAFKDEISRDVQLDPQTQVFLLMRPINSRIKSFEMASREIDSQSNPKTRQTEEELNAVRLKQEKVAALMKKFNTLYKDGKYEEAERYALLAKEVDPDNPVVSGPIVIAGAYRLAGDERPKLTEFSQILEESRAPEQLTAMPRPVTPDSPMTCPYLTGQTKPCPVVSGNVDLENSVLANLERLTTAEEVLKKGQQCQQNGDAVMALVYFATVRKMVPGSNLDEMAAHAMASLQSTTTTPVKVIVTVTVDCGAQRLHEEAVKRAQARAALSRESQRELEIRKKLKESVGKLKYEDVPLVKVIDDLSTTQKLNIYIDRPALLEEGVNLDCPVTITLDEVSLRNALNVILHQAKLTWIIKDEVLQITTERAMTGRLETRTYPVAKLLKGDLYVTGTGTSQERLIKLITCTIQPRSWADMGGPGTIEYYPLSPGLVINQTPDVQEQIEDLLDWLRRQQEIDAAYADPRIQKRMETRIYNVVDLVKENVNYNILGGCCSGCYIEKKDTDSPEVKLIKRIHRNVEPHSWSGSGGYGTVAFDQDTRSIVVKQTSEVHERITSWIFDLRALNDPNYADVQKGTRVELAYLQRACLQAVEQGRLDKAAELACETLALDESAHLLSLFGRVYLTHVKSEPCSRHASGKVQGTEEESEPVDTNECPSMPGSTCPGGGCKTHEGNEDCPPMKPTSEPEKSVSELGLMWPVITPPDVIVRGHYFCEPPPPPPCPVIVPWCLELPSVDIHTPVGIYQIRAEAPLSVVNIPLLILDEKQSEKAQVIDPDSASKHDCSWAKVMAGPMRAEVFPFDWETDLPVYERYCIGGFHSMGGSHDLFLWHLLFNRGADGKDVDGNLSMNLVSQD